MSHYAIVHLDDVKNVAPRFQMPEGMDTASRRAISVAASAASASASRSCRPACGSPLGEESDGEIVPGWWTA
jgi:hypothetical protein